MMRNVKILGVLAVVLFLGFALLQVFPIGAVFSSMEEAGNPPIENTIEWASPEVELLVRRSCYDCHSNETVYPWYANIAPVSWLVNKDINDGRAGLNFSTDSAYDINPEDLLWHLETDMPPAIYTLMHRDAVLSAEQQQTLYNGIIESLQLNPDMEGTHNMDDM